MRTDSSKRQSYILLLDASREYIDFASSRIFITLVGDCGSINLVSPFSTVCTLIIILSRSNIQAFLRFSGSCSTFSHLLLVLEAVSSLSLQLNLGSFLTVLLKAAKSLLFLIISSFFVYQYVSILGLGEGFPLIDFFYPSKLLLEGVD